MRYIFSTLIVLCNVTIALFSQPVDNPVFNFERGFYNSPILVNIQTTSSAVSIYYTLDGSAPSPTNGTLYTMPIVIMNTTFVRAIAYTLTDTSEVVTHTYLYLDETLDAATNTLQKEALLDIPSLSIVTNNAITTSDPVAASAEFIYPNSSLNHQVNAGIRYPNGGAGNFYEKKTMRLYFKQEFGQEKLDFNLFNPSPYGIASTQEFDKINLRYGSQDNIVGWAQIPPTVFLRNRWGFDTQLEMGWNAPHGNYMHVYLNGLYNGMYHVHELPDESFQEEYRGGNKEEYDVIKNGEVVEGSDTTWYYASDLLGAGDYDGFSTYVDVENFIDYHLLSWYQGNTDWPQNNWYMSRRRANGEKFQFFCWDMDRSMQVDSTNNVSYSAGFNISLLMQHPDFALLMQDRIYKHFFCNGILTPEKSTERFVSRVNEIKKGVIAETARWEDAPSSEIPSQASWLNNVDWYLNSYFPQRTQIVLEQLIDADYYSTISPVGFSQTGGSVFPGFQLTLFNPNGLGTIYYTSDGTDPRLPGGGIAPSAQIYTGSFSLPSAVATVWARVLIGTTWSPACPATFYFPQDYENLVFNEIHYHPNDSLPLNSDDFEFIELKNIGTTSIDLTGTAFSDGIQFTFKEQHIQPDDFIVLAKDSIAFLQKYNFAPDGQYKGKLSNGGESIALSDPLGNLIDSVLYNDKIPWDTLADGHGPSLEFINSDFDNSFPASWKHSIQDAGTPGAENTIRCTNMTSNLIINEFNYTYNTLYKSLEAEDWIEIYNAGAYPVDMSNWIIQDQDISYVIPPGTVLGTGQYQIFAEDLFMFNRAHPSINAIGPTAMGLSKRGETLSLLDANSCPVDGVIYGVSSPWDSTKYSTLSLFNPALNNTEAASWSTSGNYGGTPGKENIFPCNNTTEGIIINEINYKSAENPNPGDWIELHNTNTNAIDISGWEFHDFSSFYTIPNGTIIPPLGYHVLVNNIDSFSNIFPSVSNFSGNLGYGLDGDGELIGLFNQHRCLIDSVYYNDAPPWNIEPDGNGATLALISPDLNNNLPGSWVASDQGNATYGTPGAANNISDPCVPPNPLIVINEICYAPAINTSGDWLELYNRSEYAADLSRWMLQYGNTSYTFPIGTIIPANDFLILVQSGTAFNSQFAGINNYLSIPTLDLSNTGEKLMLYSAQSCLVDVVHYLNTTPWPFNINGQIPSISLIYPYSDNNNPNNWMLSENTSTPAAPNSIICRPGNIISSSALWLKADAGITSAGSSPGDGSIVDGWDDQSGNNINASQTIPLQMPVYYENIINGHPVLRWDGVDDWYKINDIAGILSGEATFFTVVEPFAALDNGYYLSTNTGGYNRIKFGHNPAGELIYDDDVTSLSSENYENKKTIIACNITPDVRVEAYINGKTSIPWTVNMVSTGADRASIGQEFDGAGGDSETSNHWKGDLAEILIYDRMLSENERKTIETYLAIKYGITIAVENHLYYDHEQYAHNIAGLGSDITQCLEQYNSMSVHEEAIVRMQAGNHFSQGDYLVWGHDGIAPSTTTSQLPNTSLKALARSWRITETGDAGTVSVSFDLTGLGLDLSDVNNFALLIDGDDGNFSNAYTHYTGRNIDNNIVTFNDVDFKDDDWFTLAVQQQSCPINNFALPTNACYLTPSTFLPDVVIPGAIYEWSFEQGLPSYISNSNATTVWNDVNTSTVTLTITYAHCQDVITKTINVDICNELPIAQNDTYGTLEDIPLVSNVMINDSDPDNQNIFLDTTAVSPTQYGSLNILPNGSFTYTPRQNFYGIDSFTYIICDDGTPIFCDSAMVSINISPINDAPVAYSDTAYVYENEFIEGNLLDNDMDPENNELIMGGNPTTYPENGSVVLQNDGTFYYFPVEDYVGIDSFSYLVCDMASPSACTQGTAFMIIEEGCVSADLKVWLEGAYIDTLNEMKTALNTTLQILPGQFPNTTPAGQPYYIPPWNYPGMEGIDFSIYPPDVVDWVLVSFRSTPEKNTEIAQAAALLLKDGTVQFIDDCGLTTSDPSSLYVVIEHRNHIGVMTPSPIVIFNRVLTYDFTTDDSYKDATSYGQKEISPGIWTMLVGDGSQVTDAVGYDINGSDKIIWQNVNGAFSEYIPADYNMDGDVNGADKIMWLDNNGASSRVPK